MLLLEGFMEKLFDVNNKFFTFMGKLFDLIVLNVLWVLTLVCFVGPACTGLYYAIAKNIRKDRDYATKSFFHSFKQNFKQASVIGILQIVIGFGLWWCYQFALAMDPNVTFSKIYFWAILVLIVLFIMMSIYVYPILSRFSMKTTAILKLALYMSVRHPLTTIVGFAGIVIAIVYPALVFFSPLVLCVIGLYVLLLSFPMEKALRKYMPKKEDADENEQEAWYYE